MDNVVQFLMGLLILMTIIIGVEAVLIINRKRYLRLRIKEEYGQEIDTGDILYKMDSVSNYFNNFTESNLIDDITWNDLNMDEIYKKINNTQSSCGREVLYKLLRTPIHNDEELKKRDKVIEYFNENKEARENIQYILANLGTAKSSYVTNCILEGVNNKLSDIRIYKILSILPLASLVLMLFDKNFIVLCIVTTTINILISQNSKKSIKDLDSYSYIIKTINTAKKIKNLNIEQLDENMKDIKGSLESTKALRYKSLGSSGNAFSDVDVFKECIDLILLKEKINYEKAKKIFMENREDIVNLYSYVGEVDSLIAIASYRESIKYYSKPKLHISKSKSNNYINFKDIYHPLIKEPVTNSAEFNKSILLTGSNASGKSTFIKTVAINAVLAQTIYTTLSSSYESTYFNIYTSMALKDDIVSNESYYIVEIKSLKRILESSNKDIPCLCFVDEILRGTNTVERISSSCEVLKYIQGNNTLCFAATHDIELTYLLEDNFENYHFEETITKNDIEFDYKLQRGRAQTRNAIKLLEFMGYDKNIVVNADKRAKEFLLSGSW